MSSARILVVEDDAALAEVLRVHLANAGYEVVLAEDAVAAGPALLQRAPKVDLARRALPAPKPFLVDDLLPVVRQVATHAG